MDKNIFSEEKDLLMFYHTTFRNILNLLTLSVVILTFSFRLKNKNYKILIKIFTLFLLIFAQYFNISLTKIYENDNKKKFKFVRNYIIVNYLLTFIITSIIIFTFFKLYKIFF